MSKIDRLITLLRFKKKQIVMEKQYEPKEDSVTLGNMSSMTPNLEQTSELTIKEVPTATVNELIVTTIPVNEKERKTTKPDALPNKVTERVYHFRQAIIAEDTSNHQPTGKQDIRQPDERRKELVVVDDKEHTHHTEEKGNKYDDDKAHIHHPEEKDNKYDDDKDDDKDDKDDKDDDDDDNGEDNHKDSDDDDSDDIYDKIMPAITSNTISKFTMTSVDPIVTSFLVGYGAAAGHAEDEIDGLGLVGMVQPSAEFSSDACKVSFNSLLTLWICIMTIYCLWIRRC